MKRNGNAKRLRTAFAAALVAALAALLFAGCKDLFHPEGQEGGDDYYTVTFNLNGGNIGGSAANVTRTVSAGSSIGNMPQPTWSDHAFGGWYNNQSGTGTAFTGSTPVTGNRTVYAKWTANSGAYTVTFNAQYGTPGTQTRTVNSGGSLGSDMPDEPVRNGYAFDGWYDNQSGAGTAFTGSTPVTGNRAVYAKWAAEPADPHKYELTRNHGETWDNYAFVASDFLPERFAVSAGDRIEISFLIKTDTKLDGFSIGIGDWGNGIIGDSGWIAVDWNSTRSVPADGRFHRCAWTLTAQAFGPDGDEPLRIQFATDVVSKPKITIYVGSVTVANASAHTVTFNADGGRFDGGDGTQTRAIASGGSLGASMPSDPSKSGYVFEGWYADRNGSGEEFTPATTVASDITVYAKWIERYTVTFNADGGSFSEGGETRTIPIGSGYSLGASMPSDPNKSGYTLEGWYAGRNGGGEEFTSSTTVTGNRTVYAKWTIAVLPSNLSLAQSLAWITSNAMEGGAYAITVRADEPIGPQTLSYSGKNVNITLDGGTSEERWIILSSAGSLFTVESGVTLTLDNNITLQGRNNTASLITINSGGTLVMNAGSKVTGNTSSSGGGVFVDSNGRFTMSGGTISGNTASSSGGGGGVAVGGTFTMNGGEISGNTASSYGGGVSVWSSGTFIKQSGGVIYGSNASASLKNTARNDSYGHAVFVYSSPSKRRNSTAGTGVTLNSGVSGSNGGWL